MDTKDSDGKPALQHTPVPWSDLKVAFGVDDMDAFESWMTSTNDGRGILPAGWSLCETDASGARYVAVFRVDGHLTIEDARTVLRMVPGLYQEAR